MFQKLRNKWSYKRHNKIILGSLAYRQQFALKNHGHIVCHRVLSNSIEKASRKTLSAWTTEVKKKINAIDTSLINITFSPKTLVFLVEQILAYKSTNLKKKGQHDNASFASLGCAYLTHCAAEPKVEDQGRHWCIIISTLSNYIEIFRPEMN